jgi:hypothetical protein
VLNILSFGKRSAEIVQPSVEVNDLSGEVRFQELVESTVEQIVKKELGVFLVNLESFFLKQFQSQEGTSLVIHDDVKELSRYVKSVRRLVKGLQTEVDEIPKNEYVAESVESLDPQEKANEILSTLFDKMEKPHGSKLRPFYVDLERSLHIKISKLHKERIPSIKGDLSKYPNRKIDTILIHANPQVVHEYAKKYTFIK